MIVHPGNWLSWKTNEISQTQTYVLEFGHM